MGSSIIGLAVLLTGINVGWQRLEDGGYVYIIQIEPEILDSLRAGQAIQSDLPPNLRGIRSYRIVVGKGMVPQEGTPELPEQPPAPSPSQPVPRSIAFPGDATPLPPQVEKDRSAEQTAQFIRETEERKPAVEPESQPRQDTKPWQPLVVTLALLLASLSGNFYMGWITWETRGRYRRLLRRFHEPRDVPEHVDLPETRDQAE